MNKLLKKARAQKWYPLASGAVSLLLGAWMMWNPWAQMEALAMVIGVAFLVWAVLRLLLGLILKEDAGKRVLRVLAAAILVVMGVLTVRSRETVGEYLPVLVGFLFILFALVSLVRWIFFRKKAGRFGELFLVLSFPAVLLGYMVLTRPGFAGAVLSVVTGLFLAAAGIVRLLRAAGVKMPMKASNASGK